jgi:hypothetical protein
MCLWMAPASFNQTFLAAGLETLDPGSVIGAAGGLTEPAGEIWAWSLSREPTPPKT